MISELALSTRRRAELIHITPEVQRVVRDSGVTSGTCIVYAPHTTAGITINENADPDVQRDILDQLERLVPRQGGYHHMEGNADAHIKASMMGFAATLFVENGALVLGTWQGIFFCEFDGPRSRHVYVKVIADPR
jgi:secondary thiamine-phosphate synthase enzyme